MKVLFFLHSLSSGGAERVTATLANYWVGRGWEITVVTVVGVDRDFYSLDGRIHRIGLDLAIQSRHVGLAAVNNLRRIWALHGILLKKKPDVALGLMTTANATLAMAGRMAGVVTVGSERIYPPAMPLGRNWEQIRRRTYPLLNCLVGQTSEIAEWLRENAPAKRIAVIPNPIQFPVGTCTPLASPAEVIASLGGERLLLAVGRLEPQKGHDRLIEAFARVSDRHPGWSLVILGRGRLQNDLTQQAAAYGIADRVALPGAVGNVGDWLDAADAYALTSRFEGFPNTLIEAMAYGVPALAVDCKTGPREILRHEVDGLLVPQDDPSQLSNSLDRLLGDESLRARFSRSAVEVRQRFAVDRIAQQWETLFRELI